MLKVIGFDNTVSETSIAERKNFKWIWIDIFNPTEDEMETVSRDFSIPLDELRDIMELEDIPRIEKEKNEMRLFFRIPFSNETVSTIAIILGPNYIISFHEEKAVPIKVVYKRIKRLKVRNPTELMIKIIEVSVRHFEKIDEKIEKELDRLEERLISGRDISITKLYEWRERIGDLYRALLLNKTVISDLLKTKRLRSQEREKVDDIYYDVLQLIDFFSSHKESIVNLVELHMNMQNIKLQEIMKFLAVVTFVAAIPTVISSIYGMNFKHLPLASHPMGFWISIIVMTAIVVASLAYFKKKKWI